MRHEIVLMRFAHREEEEPEEYAFPLTLRQKKPTGTQLPVDGVLNGAA
jgi:hypothetical protein